MVDSARRPTSGRSARLLDCAHDRRHDWAHVLITGGNAGIGKETAVELAAAGATVVFTARNAQRGADALAEIRSRSGSDAVDVMALDLASLASVREFARQFADDARPPRRADQQRGPDPQQTPRDRGRLRDDLPGQPPRAVPAHRVVARPARRRHVGPGRERRVRRAQERAPRARLRRPANGEPPLPRVLASTGRRSSRTSCSRASWPAAGTTPASPPTPSTRGSSPAASVATATPAAPETSSWGS